MKITPGPNSVAHVAEREWVPLEKTEEQWGDDLMARHGYFTVRLSQARETNQTPGIPDRKYYHEGWGHTVWWEAKRQKRARTSQAQYDFERRARACGEEYVRGPFSALEAYMKQRLPELRKRRRA